MPHDDVTTSRRNFLKTIAAAGFVSPAFGESAHPPVLVPTSVGDGAAERKFWIATAIRVATPVLDALSHRHLKATMPVEERAGSHRADFSHLEALGRTLAGLAPWLEHAGDPEATRLASLAREGIDAATDPASPDFLNFSRGSQPLVDAAFLALATLRAPQALWVRLDARVKQNLTRCLAATRVIQPPPSNWRLFASIIEVALQRAGAPRNEARLFDGLRSHREWYVGDGYYGDGPEFHFDYYNAFVIHPMLLETLDAVAGEAGEWREFRDAELHRLPRFAAVQERLIAPDGSYPAIGRSITYRCGAFQGLALAAQRRLLPPEVTPGRARTALTSVIRRTLDAPGTFDADGWLRIGLSGHQPGLGEEYISTGSLYLCTAAFLPLGRAADDPFWFGLAELTTWDRLWSGVNLPADHALRDSAPRPGRDHKT